MVEQAVVKVIKAFLCGMLLITTACNHVKEKTEPAIQPFQQTRPQNRALNSSFRYHILLRNATLENFLLQFRMYVEIEHGQQFMYSEEWEDGVQRDEVIRLFCAERVSFSELLRRFEEQTGLRIEVQIDRGNCTATIRVGKAKERKHKKRHLDAKQSEIRKFTAYVPKKLIKMLQTERHQPCALLSWQKETPYFQALRGLTGDYNPRKIDLLRLALTLADIKVRFKKASDTDITYFHVEAPVIITNIPNSVDKGETIFVTGPMDFYFSSIPHPDAGGDWILHAWQVWGITYATSFDEPKFLKDLLREWLDYWRRSPYKSAVVMDYSEFRKLMRQRRNLIEIVN